MTDSILNSVKKVLGLADDYDVFDQDVIMHINSVFSTLNQLGIGPDKGYAIEDATGVWADFLDDDARLNSVRSYVYLRVRVLFDPPTTSFLLDAFAKQIEQMEWRLNVVRETDSWTNPNVGDLGKPLDVVAGLPLHERFRVTNGKDIWSDLDLFTVVFVLSESQDPKARPFSNLAQYVVVSYDDNDIVLDWSMLGLQTKFLKSGYYRLDLSDIGENPVKIIRILSGQFRVKY